MLRRLSKTIIPYNKTNPSNFKRYFSGLNLKKNNINYDLITNSQIVDSNFGVKEFVKKTYLWTGGGICGSIGFSLLGAKYGLEIIDSIKSLEILFGTGAILSVGGTIGMCFTNYKVLAKQMLTNTGSQTNVYYSINSIPRILSYCSLVVGNGIIMTPIFSTMPNAVLPAFIASSSVFAGATMYTMTRKAGELDSWGATLYSSLTGLVGVSLLGLGSQLFLGQNWFSDTTHLISLYGGVPLFTGLVAYDTHIAIQRYLSNDPDHLGCATGLYLDFINLFVRFMEIISKIQNNNK